jgi:hypothetical protein
MNNGRSNKELDRTAHGCRPARLAVSAAGQFRRWADVWNSNAMGALLSLLLAAGLSTACGLRGSQLRAPSTPRSPAEEVVALALQHELNIAEAHRRDAGHQPIYVQVTGKPVSKKLLQLLRLPKGYRLRPAPSWRCLTSGCWNVSVSSVERDGRACMRVKVEHGELCGDCRARCRDCPVPIVMASCYEESEWCRDGEGWQFRTRDTGCWDS